METAGTMHGSSSDRNAVEVLAEEFVDRYRRGERPPLSEYTRRFPEHADEIRDLFPALLMMENLKPAEDSAAVAKTSCLDLQQLGDYRIIREVGRGGMGIVYEAEQVSLGRHVALKVLPKEKVCSPEQRLRFEREAKAAAKLHHSNIVPVFGVGDTDGQLYYVMQFIQGLALDDVLVELKRLRLAANGNAQNASEDPSVSSLDVSVLELAQTLLSIDLPHLYDTPTVTTRLSEPFTANSVLPAVPAQRSKTETRTGTAGAASSSVVLPGRSAESGHNAPRQTTYFESIAQIGVQVARALDYAHSQGILHRDIKPANLVLDLKGTVWVTDFGLAKLDDERGLTQAGDIIGTLRYMSPESFKAQYDKRSEVYSLGLTLYEMLAFRPAFTESSRNALIDHVMNSQVDRLAKLNPKIPADLQTIIHKSIERDPDHRYQSAAELADDLQRFLNDEPIQARRVSIVERLTRWSRHHRSLAAALATVMVLVSLLAGGSTAAAWYFRAVNGTLKTTVSNLETAQSKLSDNVQELNSLTQQLTASRNEEVKKSGEAETARRAAQTLLADMQTERGLLAAEQGDSATAMLWFAHAADQTDHDPQRQAANRLRAKNAMNDAVLPAALLPQVGSAEPRQLTFRPQGDLLLSLQGNRLQVWDWEREQSLPWANDLNSVIEARWSPDGRHVAVGLVSGEVQIRTAARGNVVQRLVVAKPIESLAWSRDGSRLATAGQMVQIWNLSASPLLEHVCEHPAPVYSVLFKRDGTRLVTGCRDGKARVFVIGGTRTQLSPAIASLPHAPTFESPPVIVDGGRRLITIPDSDRIGWWDIETGAEAAPPSARLDTYFARRLSASDDGERFAVAADPPMVWNISGERQILKHVNHVPHVAFDPLGTTVATACNDWMARIWSIPDSTKPPLVVPQLESVVQCAYTQDGRHLAVCGIDKIRVWRLPERSGVITGHAGWNQAGLQPRPGFDGRWIAPGRWHEAPSFIQPLSMLTVVDVAGGKPAGPAININRMVDSCLCPDNRSVAIVSATETGGRLTIVDVASGRESCGFTLTGAPGSVTSRAGTNDVAVLCQNGQILVVDQRQGTRRFEIATESPDRDVWHSRVRYTPDGHRLVHLTAQNQIAVYDATTGWSCFAKIRPVLSEGACRTMAISSDSRWLATGVNGKNALQVWDLSTGQAVSEPLLHPGDFFGIFAIEFSPDGRWVLSGNKDGRARLWDWRTGQQVCPPLQHADEVHCVAFAPEGHYALTGVRHGGLRLWELATGKMIASPVQYPLFVHGSTTSVVVVKDRVVVSGRDFPIIRLDPLLAESSIPTESLQSLAQLATGRRLQLGELSGLSATEWDVLWDKIREREFTPETRAQSLAFEIDRAGDVRSRMMIGEQAAKSAMVFDELLRLRSDVPELQVVLARINEQRGVDLAAKAIERAIRLYEHQIADDVADEARAVASGEEAGQFSVNQHTDVAQAAEQLTKLLLTKSGLRWRPIEFRMGKSRSSAVISRRKDGAFLVSGENPLADVYTLTAIDGGENVAAIRLDALTDPSLPSQGPGRHSSGNFQLSAFRLFRPSADESQSAQIVPLSAADASYSYPSPDVDVRGTIQEGSTLAWHVWGATGQPHHAVFVLKQPITINPQHPLIIQLQHRDVGTPVNLGCFKLSASADPRAFDHDGEQRDIQSQVYPGTLALAATYMLLERHDQAIELLERMPRLHEATSAGIRLMLLCECHQRLNQPEAARHVYDRLLVWLGIDRLPESLEKRVIELMQSVGGLTAVRARSNYQRLRIEFDICGLTEQIEREPMTAILYGQRATLYARLGQWRLSAADHVRTTELVPNDRLTWTRAAAHLVLANDLDGYQTLCRRLLLQFPQAIVPLVADSVCKSCLLLPDVVPLSELPTETLYQSLGENDPFVTWCTAACALIALREGSYPKAIELSQRFGDSPRDIPGALLLVCRSMAQFHVQDLTAARRSLQQAEAIVPEVLRTVGTSQHSDSAVVGSEVLIHDWLIAEILRREAAHLIHPADESSPD